METKPLPKIKKPNKMRNLIENFPKHISAPSQILFINIITTPLERFQILHQLKPQLKNFGLIYKTNKSILTQMLQESKLSIFKGLKIGIYTNLFSHYLSSRLYFKTKNNLQKKIFKKNPENPTIYLNASASIISTTILSLFLHPLNVGKLKIMAEISPIKKNIYSGFFKTLDEIKFNEGWKALYRGFIFGLWKNFIGMGLAVFMMDSFTEKIQNNKFLAFSAIGAFHGVVVYPLDTVL